MKDEKIVTQELRTVTRPAKEEPGKTIRKETQCGNLYVTVAGNPPNQLFISMGKAGGCYSCLMGSMGRLIGMALQDGMSVERVIKALKGERCPGVSWDNGKQILSCPDAISQALTEYMEMIGRPVVIDEQKINKVVDRFKVVDQVNTNNENPEN